MDDELNGVAKGVLFAFGLLYAVVMGVLLTWWTVVAFIGGTMPIIEIEREPSLVFGLFWLFIADPIAASVLFFVGRVFAMPLVAVAMLFGRR